LKSSHLHKIADRNMQLQVYREN